MRGDIQNIKRWNKFHRDVYRLSILDTERTYMHSDHPYRENVNSIDRFLLRAKEFSCSENLKFFILSEYVHSIKFRPETMRPYHLVFINRSGKSISLTYRKKFPQISSRGCDIFLRKYEVKNQLSEAMAILFQYIVVFLHELTSLHIVLMARLR